MDQQGKRPKGLTEGWHIGRCQHKSVAFFFSMVLGEDATERKGWGGAVSLPGVEGGGRQCPTGGQGCQAMETEAKASGSLVK